jgi:hypothetical protein
MMEIGFTLWQCMNEKLENSDSANAANMKITLRDGTLVIADDGDGMNEEEMKICGRFHNRTSSAADKHGTKGVGGNIADINLSGGGRVIYCSKSVSSSSSSSSSSSHRVTSMELNYGVQTEEEYRPRPQEAPRRIEEEVWDKFSLDKTRTGTVQLYETVPRKIYKELVESIKANDIIHSFRRIWAFTYESLLRSGKTIIFDVEGEEFTIHPIDMMKYSETDDSMHKTKRREFIIRIQEVSCVIVIIQTATKEMKLRKHDRNKTDLRKSAILQLLIPTIKIGASCTKKKWNEMELMFLVIVVTTKIS